MDGVRRAVRGGHPAAAGHAAGGRARADRGRVGAGRRCWRRARRGAVAVNQGRRYRLLDNAAVRLLAPGPARCRSPGRCSTCCRRAADRRAGRPERGRAVPGLGALASPTWSGSGRADRQSFVVLADGLAPVSELTAALLVAAGAAEVPVDPAGQHPGPVPGPAVGDPGWPEVVPQPVGAAAGPAAVPGHHPGRARR